MDRGAWRATVHAVAPFQSPPSSLHGVYPVCLSVSKVPPLIRTPGLSNGGSSIGPRPLEKLVTSGPSRAAQTTSCHVYV